MKLHTLFIATTVTLVTLASAACGGSPGQEQSQDGPEQRSSAAITYDPSFGCTLVSPPRETIAASTIGSYGIPTTNGLYGYPGCLNQDVVDFTSLSRATYRLRVRWADTTITSPASCKAASVGGEAYGLERALDGSSSAYVLIGRASAHGEWFTSWTGNYCYLEAYLGEVTASQFASVRVIGTATSNANAAIHDRVVEVLERER